MNLDTQLHGAVRRGAYEGLRYNDSNSPSESVSAAKLRALADLQEGWNYGEGAAFSPSHLQRMEMLLRRVESAGFLETDVFPGPDGNVVLAVYLPDVYFEIELRKNGSLEFIHELPSGQAVEALTESTEDAILQYMRRVRSGTWNSSESSTSSTTGTSGRSVSTALHSNQAVSLPVYRLLTANAFGNTDIPFAST